VNGQQESNPELMTSSPATFWFADLFGFDESTRSYEEIQSSFQVIDDKLISLSNNRVFQIGNFRCESLKELRSEALSMISSKSDDDTQSSSTLEVKHEIMHDALELGAKYPGSTMQAASQFNCLEFSNPHVCPEQGIAFYSTDYTQGPACAIACAAGTLYRNYFVPIDGHIGQTADRQLNNLDAFASAIQSCTDKHHSSYWEISNGYTFSTEKQLSQLDALLETYGEDVIGEIKVGVHRDVGVVFAKRKVPPMSPEDEGVVTQVYSSALSCAYSGNNTCIATSTSTNSVT
jgi:hypothetical protein